MQEIVEAVQPAVCHLAGDREIVELGFGRGRLEEFVERLEALARA